MDRQKYRHRITLDLFLRLFLCFGQTGGDRPRGLEKSPEQNRLMSQASDSALMGKQTLRGHHQNLLHQEPGERSTDSKETDSDLPMSVQESPVEAWVSGGLLHRTLALRSLSEQETRRAD